MDIVDGRPGRPARYWTRRAMPRAVRRHIRRGHRCARRAAQRRGLAPAHGRRAARDVLQRRHRFEPRRPRSPRGTAGRRDQHVLGRLPRGGLRRERVRAHGGAGLRDEPSRTADRRRREFAELLPRLVVAPRPAAQLRELRAHLRGEQARAPARDGGADRRRRGRAVRRISALLHPAPRRADSRACPVPSAGRRPRSWTLRRTTGSRSSRRFARRTMADGLLFNCTGVDPSQVRAPAALVDRSRPRRRREQLARAVAARLATTSARWPSSTSRPISSRS